MKTMTYRLLIGVALVGAVPPYAGALHAQSDPFAAATARVGPIEVGDEIRVSWYQDRFSHGFVGPQITSGEVVDVNDGGILLRHGARMITVPAPTVRRVQRRIGTRPATAPEMVGGSAAGFAVGFAVGALTGGLNHNSPNIDRVEAGVTTAVLFGAPLGAFAAWLNSRSRGIYEDVPFGQVISSMFLDPRGGVGVSIPTGAP